MNCKRCNEPIVHKSEVPTICRDCYEIDDMGRFKVVDTRPADQSDTECNYRVFDPVTGEWKPLMHTKPSYPFLEPDYLGESVGSAVSRFRADLAAVDRNKPGLLPRLFQWLADKVDK